MSTVFISLLLLFQKSQIAIVIMRYSAVQTGAKTQSGGFKFDLINCPYQGSLKFIVANPPINEAEKVMNKNRRNDRNLFFNIKNNIKKN